MKKKFYLVLIILTLFLTLLTTLLPQNVFISPDELSLDYISRQASKEGDIKIKINNGESYGGLVHPRNSINLNGNIVPQSFLGGVFINSTLFSILGVWGKTSLKMALMFIFGVYALYLFRRLGGCRTSILAPTVLLILLSPLYSTSSLVVPFIFCSIYYLSSTNLYDKNNFLILFSIFAGATIFIRYEYLVFLAPFFITFLYSRKIIKSKKILLYLFLPMAFFILLILSYNFYLYGSPFLVGYSFDWQSSDTGFNSANSFLSKISGYIFPYGLNLPSIFKIFKAYLFFLAPTAFFGTLVLAKKDFVNDRQKRLLKYSILLCFLLILCYYGSNPNFYQDDLPSFSSSYPRYFSFILTFGTLSLSLRRFNFNNRLLTIVVSIILIVSLLSLSHEFSETQTTLKNYQSIKSGILNLTEDQSIIFTYYLDKIIWPERFVATSSNQSEGEVINSLRKMQNDGFTVYISKDSIYYQNISQSESIRLSFQDYLEIYKVEKVLI